jgi:hypothetical protein
MQISVRLAAMNAQSISTPIARNAPKPAIVALKNVGAWQQHKVKDD